MKLTVLDKEDEGRLDEEDEDGLDEEELAPREFDWFDWFDWFDLFDLFDWLDVLPNGLWIFTSLILLYIAHKKWAIFGPFAHQKKNRSG